jgi:thymidylate synthase
VRGSRTKELRNWTTTLQYPLERCLFLPNRGSQITTVVAETLWVLAGRNDIAWLSHYLITANEYSDDGKVWRGGYGPRVRNWHGIDQIGEIHDLLLSEPFSRRAVMSVYDPSVDFTSSKDIPCNNWLSWLNRDGRLHLNVAIRSNDAIKGFSAINAFEWSVLLDMMSFWLGLRPGALTFFASSFHVYEADYNLANEIVGAFPGSTAYDYGVPIPPFQTPWDQFRSTLNDWFKAEEMLRTSDEPSLAITESVSDPFLQSTLRLVRLKWGRLHALWNDDRIRSELHHLPEDDFAAAAYELYGRKRPEVLIDIPQPRIAAYFRALKDGDVAFAGDCLKNAIKSIHSRKDKAYGAAWKRRGERISIVPNIARKVDRLAVFAKNDDILADEPMFDTAVDLFVYATKYRLFLADKYSVLRERVLKEPFAVPLSDNDENFNALVDLSECGNTPPTSVRYEIGIITSIFETLCTCTETDGPPGERLTLAEHLCDSVIRLITQVARERSAEVEQFVRAETGYSAS